MSTAQATHICHVDCKLIRERSPHTDTMRTIHMMYPAEPSSAAGRYQWEQNAAIKRQGRRAWRATGQGQSRECRLWDHWRNTAPESRAWRGLPLHGIRRAHRALTPVHN